MTVRARCGRWHKRKQEKNVATHVRKRKKNKWWILELGTDKIVSGPYDTKEAAEAAKKTERL